MSDQPIAVEARNVSKRYRKTWALRDCSFQLPANRIVALVGANGAGKSTLMSIISGMMPATGGSVLVGGQPVTKRHRTAVETSSRVAILAQDKPLYRDFSVADMLRFGRSTNRVWDQQRALAWLARFEVPLERACGRLSGGQRTQVALAVALGTRPLLLLLDEPLSNLDPIARSKVAGELMAEAADSDMTVLLSTHIVAELSGVSDHLLLLAAGRPILTGDVDQLLADHTRFSGPRADQPPGPGKVVSAQHTDRQSTFIVQSTGPGPGPAMVAPGWTAQSLSLDELVLTYLKGPGQAHESGEAAA